MVSQFKYRGKVESVALLALLLTGAEPVKGYTSSEGNGPFFLDVSCTGTENELVDCFQRETSSNHCTNKEVAGVRCQGIGGSFC